MIDKPTPRILVLSSLDPQGSAGVSADILSINNAGGFAMPIITNLSVQNTQSVSALFPVAVDILKQQFDAIISDSTIDSVKIGLITSTNLPAMEYILAKSPAKIVLDPVLKASTDDELGNAELLKSLLKYTFLLTPNASELEQLTGESNQELAVKKLNIPWTLITQTDNSTTLITHKLYKKSKLIKEFKYKKLSGDYHGSGCVLSSFIATKINTQTVEKACELGLEYTYKTLLSATQIGKMQLSPNQNCYEN